MMILKGLAIMSVISTLLFAIGGAICRRNIRNWAIAGAIVPWIPALVLMLVYGLAMDATLLNSALR